SKRTPRESRAMPRVVSCRIALQVPLRYIETMLPARYGGRDRPASDRSHPGVRNASHWLNREAATRAIWTRTRWVAARVARAADPAPVGGRSLVHERRGEKRVGG